jgi:hypothetical protein
MRWYEHYARRFNRFCVPVGHDFCITTDDYDQFLSAFGFVFPDLFTGFQYHVA